MLEPVPVNGADPIFTENHSYLNLWRNSLSCAICCGVAKASSSAVFSNTGPIKVPKFLFITCSVTWIPALTIFLKLLKQGVSVGATKFLGKSPVSYTHLTLPTTPYV